MYRKSLLVTLVVAGCSQYINGIEHRVFKSDFTQSLISMGSGPQYDQYIINEISKNKSTLFTEKEEGIPLILLLIATGHFKSFKYFWEVVSPDEVIELKDDEGNNLIHYLCKHGHGVFLNELLNSDKSQIYKEKLQASNNNGINGLEWACFYSQIETIEIIFNCAIVNKSELITTTLGSKIVQYWNENLLQQYSVQKDKFGKAAITILEKLVQFRISCNAETQEELLSITKNEFEDFFAQFQKEQITSTLGIVDEDHFADGTEDHSLNSSHLITPKHKKTQRHLSLNSNSSGGTIVSSPSSSPSKETTIITQLQAIDDSDIQSMFIEKNLEDSIETSDYITRGTISIGSIATSGLGDSISTNGTRGTTSKGSLDQLDDDDYDLVLDSDLTPRVTSF